MAGWSRWRSSGETIVSVRKSIRPTGSWLVWLNWAVHKSTMICVALLKQPMLLLGSESPSKGLRERGWGSETTLKSKKWIHRTTYHIYTILISTVWSRWTILVIHYSILENAKIVNIRTVIAVTFLELWESDMSRLWVTCTTRCHQCHDAWFQMFDSNTHRPAQVSHQNPAAIRCQPYKSISPCCLSPMLMLNSCSFAIFCSSISLPLIAAASCDRSELLQHALGAAAQRRPATNRTAAGLRDVAEHLRRAKRQCLRSSVECLPALKQVGGRGIKARSNWGAARCSIIIHDIILSDCLGCNVWLTEFTHPWLALRFHDVRMYICICI